MDYFSKISEWIYFLFVLQLYWIIGLFTGGIILGIFPTTYATFAIARKRIQGNDLKIGAYFWEVYKKSFFRSQLEGWIWILIGIFIYYDIRILFSYQNIIGFIFGSLFVSFLIIYGITSMLILPIHSHYELTVLNRLRLSLIIAVTFPHISVGLCIGTLIIYFISMKLPLLFLIIGISSIATLYTYLSNYSFKKVDEMGFIISSHTS